MEIVDSDIYLVNRDKKSETPKEEYVNISIDNLLDLKTALQEYMSYLVLPEGYDEDDKYFDDYE